MDPLQLHGPTPQHRHVSNQPGAATAHVLGLGPGPGMRYGSIPHIDMLYERDKDPAGRLGYGTYAVVYSGVCRRTGRRVALKKLHQVPDLTQQQGQQQGQGHGRESSQQLLLPQQQQEVHGHDGRASAPGPSMSAVATACGLRRERLSLRGQSDPGIGEGGAGPSGHIAADVPGDVLGGAVEGHMLGSGHRGCSVDGGAVPVFGGDAAVEGQPVFGCVYRGVQRPTANGHGPSASFSLPSADGYMGAGGGGAHGGDDERPLPGGAALPMIREVKVLRELHHPNIVRLLDVHPHKATFVLAFEFCGGGDLEQLIHGAVEQAGLQQGQGHRRGPAPGERGGGGAGGVGGGPCASQGSPGGGGRAADPANRVPYCQGVVKAHMQSLLRALAHCHEQGVLHRDVKPNNMLLADDGRLVLGDFGLARYLPREDDDMGLGLEDEAEEDGTGAARRAAAAATSGDRGPPVLTHQIGMRWYRAPELLYGCRTYGTAVDIWAAGCVFAELMLRRVWFQAHSDVAQLGAVFAVLGSPDRAGWPEARLLPNYLPWAPQEPQDLHALFPGAPPHAVELLASLVALNPARRPTARQALAHPYFAADPPPLPPGRLPLAPPPRRGGSNPHATAAAAHPSPAAGGHIQQLQNRHNHAQQHQQGQQLQGPPAPGDRPQAGGPGAPAAGGLLRALFGSGPWDLGRLARNGDGGDEGTADGAGTGAAAGRRPIARAWSMPSMVAFSHAAAATAAAGPAEGAATGTARAPLPAVPLLRALAGDVGEAGGPAPMEWLPPARFSLDGRTGALDFSQRPLLPLGRARAAGGQGGAAGDDLTPTATLLSPAAAALAAACAAVTAGQPGRQAQAAGAQLLMAAVAAATAPPSAAVGPAQPPAGSQQQRQQPSQQITPPATVPGWGPRWPGPGLAVRPAAAGTGGPAPAAAGLAAALAEAVRRPAVSQPGNTQARQQQQQPERAQLLCDEVLNRRDSDSASMSMSAAAAPPSDSHGQETGAAAARGSAATAVFQDPPGRGAGRRGAGALGGLSGADDWLGLGDVFGQRSPAVDIFGLPGTRPRAASRLRRVARAVTEDAEEGSGGMQVDDSMGPQAEDEEDEEEEVPDGELEEGEEDDGDGLAGRLFEDEEEEEDADADARRVVRRFSFGSLGCPSGPSGSMVTAVGAAAAVPAPAPSGSAERPSGSGRSDGGHSPSVGNPAPTPVYTHAERQQHQEHQQQAQSQAHSQGHTHVQPLPQHHGSVRASRRHALAVAAASLSGGDPMSVSGLAATTTATTAVGGAGSGVAAGALPGHHHGEPMSVSTAALSGADGGGTVGSKRPRWQLAAVREDATEGQQRHPPPPPFPPLASRFGTMEEGPPGPPGPPLQQQLHRPHRQYYHAVRHSLTPSRTDVLMQQLHEEQQAAGSTGREQQQQRPGIDASGAGGALSHGGVPGAPQGHVPVGLAGALLGAWHDRRGSSTGSGPDAAPLGPGSVSLSYGALAPPGDHRILPPPNGGPGAPGGPSAMSMVVPPPAAGAAPMLSPAYPLTGASEGADAATRLAAAAVAAAAAHGSGAAQAGPSGDAGSGLRWRPSDVCSMDCSHAPGRSHSHSPADTAPGAMAGPAAGEGPPQREVPAEVVEGATDVERGGERAAEAGPTGGGDGVAAAPTRRSVSVLAAATAEGHCGGPAAALLTEAGGGAERDGATEAMEAAEPPPSAATRTVTMATAALPAPQLQLCAPDELPTITGPVAATAAPNDAPSAAGAEGAPLPDASLAASVFPPQPRIPAASADVAAIARITAAAGLADGDADGGGRGLALAVAAGPVALSGSCHVAPARGAARRAQLPSDELYYIRQRQAQVDEALRQASQSQSEASQLAACYDDVQKQQEEEEAEQHGRPDDG